MANNQNQNDDLGDLFSNIDFEIDFDTDDFDIWSGDEEQGDKKKHVEAVPQEHVRILKPKFDIATVSHTVMFENAMEFAKQVSLKNGHRTFAWVSGSFIFGDLLEALVTARNVTVKKLYMTSLSFSQDNIDSLRNVMDLMGDDLKKVVLVFSGYQYSHEKFNLVPYMYRTLDNPKNNVQIAFGGWHTKIITFETLLGNTITIHGSANLRSSNSVEQVMIEINNRQLHQFNARIMQGIADKFGTINHNAPYNKLKRIEGKTAYEVSVEAAKGGEE